MLNRYLFCFPQGGINNIFEVIYICLEYCIKYNRILVIDTRYITTFRDDIHKYFKFESDIIYKDNIDTLFKQIRNKSIYPNIFKTNESYMATVCKIKFTKFGYMYAYINVSISLLNPYDEDVIIFSNAISGTNIKEILKITQFTPKFKKELSNRLKLLPSNFISIHIRNTDKKSDYIRFIKENEKHFINKKIFIASDSWESIDYVKKKFGVNNTFNLSYIPKELNEKYIHENNIKLDREKFVFDCLCDFFILYFGKEYYYSCKDSGYSKNVEILRKYNSLKDKSLI